MLHSINMQNFKCFKDTTLTLPRLTVLTGMNASGKSTAIQTLAMLVQDACEADALRTLCLNGSLLQLGKPEDVLNKQHAKKDFSITLGLEGGDTVFSFVLNPQKQEFLAHVTAHWLDIVQDANVTVDRLGKAAESLLKCSAYICADRLGPREMHDIDTSSPYSSVGARGERTVQVLYDSEDWEVEDALLHDKEPVPSLPKQTQAYMRDLFPGFTLDIQPVQRTNLATVGLSVCDGVGYVRPQNIGFGLSSALPIIVAGLYAAEDEMVMVENPEIHLHPCGQSTMGGFLAKVAASGPQVMVETHSDHVLNGIRKAVKNKVLTPDDVAIYFFKDMSSTGEPDIERLSLDEAGNVSHWPEGFFDQHDKDLDTLLGW